MNKNVYEAVVDGLDLKQAVQDSSQRNDLLPPRPDDKVGGELGIRFSEWLRSQMQRGRYEPDAASFVPVPKQGFLTRPAALLTLTDRVVYEALTAALRPRSEKAILSSDIVLWPRGFVAKSRWKEFESSEHGSVDGYVVKADISGFYDSISHDLLAELLIKATGRRDVVAALMDFLGRVMRASKGVPQGLVPSDLLATVYLSSVDAAMVTLGFDYRRHGDDIRIFADDFPSARRALSILESNVRRHSLLLNPSKSQIWKQRSYRRSQSRVDNLVKKAKETLINDKLEVLRGGGDSALARAVSEADLEQIGWDFFYHASIELEEVIEAVSRTMKPDDVEVSKALLDRVVLKRKANATQTDKEIFHVLVTRSLIRLAAAKSDLGINPAKIILDEYPEKAELICTYFSALTEEGQPKVINAIEEALWSNNFRTGWEYGWLMRAAASASKRATERLSVRVKAIAFDEDMEWLARVESAKFLAGRQELDQRLVTRLWQRSDQPYKADVVEAVAMLQDPPAWAVGFLNSAKLDPVYSIVVAHTLPQKSI